METTHDATINELSRKNQIFMEEYHHILPHHISGQQPKIAVLTCSDSRVVPEFIFNAQIGELFIVRTAGNIAIDETVIESLEYAVDHLKITHLIILGHTHCGAVNAAEQTPISTSKLLKEIQKSFPIDEKNHEKANLIHQLQSLPTHSNIIKNAVETDALHLVGALYHLNDGHVEFLRKENMGHLFMKV